MKLIQRVMTLIRANLNDLLERAEDPELMIKQLILDLNNQLIQVKTAVAQSLADQYLIEKRLEHMAREAEACQRRAQTAVDKQDDDQARTALQAYNSYQRTIEETERQLEEQRKESDALKLALNQLEIKISEITRQKHVLLSRHRRATAKEKLSKARSSIHPERLEQLLDAIGGYVDTAEARAKATEDIERHAEARKAMKAEEDQALNDQLASLKARRQQPSDAAA